MYLALILYVTNVVPSTSSCRLSNNNVGPPAMKNLSFWLDCWGEISQVLWKVRHENILWDCKQLIRENVPCEVRAEQSISCLWQMWCAWSEPLIKCWQPAWGSGVSNGGGLAQPNPNGIWGKRRGGKKKQGKECLWYWNDFTCIYSKRLETYIDLRRSWCEWRDSNQHSTLPSQVWFMPGVWQPFSWETFQNLLVYFLRKSNVL